MNSQLFHIFQIGSIFKPRLYQQYNLAMMGYKKRILGRPDYDTILISQKHLMFGFYNEEDKSVYFSRADGAASKKIYIFRKNIDLSRVNHNTPFDKDSMIDYITEHLKNLKSELND